MALFGKKESGGKILGRTKQAKGSPKVRPVMGRQAFCFVCDKRTTFSRCWLRVARIEQCEACGLEFPNPEQVYQTQIPACPRCGEYLEQPNFEYGLCDECHSKFELMTGTKPSLLPNRKQRAEMEKHGKSRSKLL